MTKDEALDLALESFAPHNGVFWRNLHKNDAEIANAITAIKQALEAPQEPEHIVHSNGRYSPLLTRMMNKRVESNVKQVIHLYDDPPAQPTERTGEAPCARHCEATAFQIVIKNLRGEIDRLKAAQPAPVQPIGYEKYAAIREGHRNASEEAYFAARPDLPLTTAMLKLFRDGFDRGYDTTPPAAKRQWVGLTEQERNDIEDYCEMIVGKPAFEAIEAKLKEKNT